MTRRSFSVIFSRLSRGVLGALALLGCAACTEPVERAQVMLSIDADESLRSRIRYVDIELRSGAEEELVWDLERTWEHVLRGERAWPIRKSITGQDKRTGYQVTATAKDADDMTVGTQRAVSRFVPGRTLALQLRFDEACVMRASPCSKTFTCRQGRCIDPYIDAQDLGAVEPGSPRGQDGSAASPGVGPRADAMPAAGSGGSADPSTPPSMRPPPPACSPGAPGCPTAACPARDEQGVCQACPVGFVDSSDGCLPVLTALGLSDGMLVPSFDPERTTYAVELPLLASRLSLDLEASSALEVMVEGERLTSSRWTGLVEFGESEIAIDLHAPGGSSRTYRLNVRRGGSQVQQLMAADAAPGDSFGLTVAASGDRLVVGAPLADGDGDTLTDSGAVYVFERRESGWEEVASLKVESPRAQARFGWTVAIDGDRIVAASPEEPAGGAIYVFELQGDAWTQVARFSGERAGALMGRGLALQGDTIVAGTPSDNEAATDGGAAHVFERSASGWTRTAILRPMALGALDWFGSSVALDGDTLLISATGHTVPGETLPSGAVFIFERDGTGMWREAQMIWQNPPVSNAFWGEAISIQGDRLVGAGFFGYTGLTGGSAAIFTRRSDGQFAQDVVLRPENSRPGDSFGVRVQLAGDTAIVGAHAESSAAPGVDAAGTGMVDQSGAVYLFEPQQGEWAQALEIKAETPAESEWFGRSVAASAGVLFVGAPGSNESGMLPGSVYVFR